MHKIRFLLKREGRGEERERGWEGKEKIGKGRGQASQIFWSTL